MVNNSFTFIGRLVRDVEINTTQSGAKACNFSLAGSVGFGDTQHSVFPNFVAWNRNAETMEKYVRKGQQIAVEAFMDEQHWEDKEGNKRTSVRFVVNNIFLTGSKKDNEAEARKNTDNEEDNSPVDIIADDESENEVPF